MTRMDHPPHERLRFPRNGSGSDRVVAFTILLGLALTALPVTAAQDAKLQQDKAATPVDPERVPRPEIRVLPAGASISIDGRLDEAAWKDVPPITEFIQAQPNTGEPATERTEVRVLFDAEHLYISAICYDSDPDGLVVKTLERDYPGVLSEDMDSFGFAIDTFLDRRNSFVFFINPRGGIKDGQTFNDGTTRDYGWDAVVDVRTTVRDEGWTVEVAIPWSTLRFDPTRDPQSWGINFLRRVRRRNEVSYWAPLERRDRIFLMSQAGTLLGLPRVPTGRNLTIKPFVLASRSSGIGLPAGDRGNNADGGLDLKFGITPRVTLDMTWRTDFSDADVDQEQVNLTRFAVFFPEQRDFFLENSGIFTLGDVTAPGAPRSGTSTRDFTLFHSRTIGLQGGRPVPLFGGGRLTGRAEDFEFGLLDVQSEHAGTSPGENFGALRVRRNIFGNSDIGFLFTNRQATGDTVQAGNRSFGTDLNMRLAQSLFINSYLAFTRGPGADDNAGRFAIGWRDRLIDVSTMFRRVGADFEPGMGFIRRTAIRQYYATAGVHPRAGNGPILEFNPYVEADYITDLSGTRASWDGTLALGTTFRDGGILTLQYDDRRELLEEPFSVRPTATIPVGDYHYSEASVNYRASEGRNLSGSIGVSGGGYYNGDRFTISSSLAWQPDYHLTIEASANHNSLSVQGSDFTADLYTARLKYAFSTVLYFGAFVQYNADAEQIVSNARLNFIHAPLSHLFIVFTERRDAAAGEVLERFLTFKLTRLFGF
jgi:Domain of unknown function (DUF5916)/Carbohydrate family 9 binding domain-like